MHGTVTVQAEVDVRDFFKEVDDDDFNRELERRGIMPSQDLSDALHAARVEDYPTVIDRMRNPKWPSYLACAKQYNEVMAR